MLLKYGVGDDSRESHMPRSQLRLCTSDYQTLSIPTAQETQLLCPCALEPVQFSRSVVSDSVRPQGTAACQDPLSITNSQNLLKLMSIESVMPSNPLILCRPLLLLPSILPSIRVFSNELVLHLGWLKD